MKKLFRVSLLLIAMSACALAQSNQPPNTTRNSAPSVPTRSIDLTVKVTYENDRPVAGSVRVQITNQMGIPVMETFTRDGEARFSGISPGVYKIRATSPEIEDTQTEQSFSLSAWDTVHFEFLRVRRKVVPGQEQDQQSSEGFISVAMMNIPGKAKKEFDKGLDALDKKDFVKAQGHFEKASTIYPKYAAAFNNLGFLAMQNGDAAAGEAFFERAVAADDQYPGAYLNLARVRWGQKRFEDAEKLLLKNTSLDPKNVEAISLLVNLNAMSGRYDNAIALSKKVHGMSHEAFPVVHYIAGLAYQSKNDLPDAATEFRQYLKEAPQGKSADQARTALAQVEQRLATK
jgi:tetratricopeptide (TPR) repeat protein